jgi:cytochrome P450
MSGNRKITAYSAMIREQCRQLIADKKAALQDSGKGRVDILSVLLKSRDLSDEEIQDQMLTFLAAGCVEDLTF